MTYQEVHKFIDELAILLHETDDDELGLGIIQDGVEAIVKYTLDKGLDYKIGNWMLSYIYHADDDTIDEEFDGRRHALLENFMEMATGSKLLIDDWPLSGQYRPIPDIDPELPPLIDYMERKFWPDYFADKEGE